MNSTSKESKSTLIAGMFYTFLGLTLVAFIFHIIGLDYFASTVEIPDPDIVIQETVKALLKLFELVFLYKLLTKKSFLISFIISVFHVASVGFLPQNEIQTIADALLMLIFPVVLRKDRIRALVDFAFVYLLCNLYGLLLIVAKFSLPAYECKYNFYANAAGMVDYKLFIVTLYLYIKYKGGIVLWKGMKRKILS